MNTSRIPDADYLHSLARHAGSIMRDALLVIGMDRTWKKDNTPVTEFDTAINRLVIASFTRDFPHIAVVGEEESSGDPNSEYVTLVDPIDGTIPFCLGLPISTFCISILKDRVPIAALISDPFSRRAWYAAKGEGTYLNGEPAHSSYNSNVTNSIVSLCFWRTGMKGLCDLTPVCRALMEREAKWINLTSVAICGGLIASGELDASIAPCRKAWETAAMQIIVEEAGGVATDIHGNKLVYSEDFTVPGHIIAGRFIHGEILDIVRSASRPAT